MSEVEYIVVGSVEPRRIKAALNSRPNGSENPERLGLALGGHYVLYATSKGVRLTTTGNAELFGMPLDANGRVQIVDAGGNVLPVGEPVDLERQSLVQGVIAAARAMAAMTCYGPAAALREALRKLDAYTGLTD